MGFLRLNDPGPLGTPEQHTRSSIDSDDLGALVGGMQGTGVVSGCAVTFTGGMGILVAAGTVANQVTETVIASPASFTLGASDPVLGRLDIVVASAAGFAVIAGTPAAPFLSGVAAGPAFPTFDPTVLAFVAAIYVGPGATFVTSANLLDSRIAPAAPLTLVVPKNTLTYSIYDFGVKGGNYSDDTTAMQNAVATVTALGAKLTMGTGDTINIDGPLTIGESTNWAIGSGGMTNIVQHADNTPIFDLTNFFTYFFHLEGLRLTWANAQPSTATAAIGVRFGSTDPRNTGAGFFNWSARRIRFNNGFAGFSTADITSKATMWGVDISKVWGEPAMSGPIFRQDSLAAGFGAPNIKLSEIYIRSDSCVGPGIIIRSASGVFLNTVEFNNHNGIHTPILVDLQIIDGLVMHACRYEMGVTHAPQPCTGDGLFTLTGVSGASITGTPMLNAVFTPVGGTAAEHYMIRVKGSSRAVRIHGVAMRAITAVAGCTVSGVGSDNSGSNQFEVSGVYITTPTGAVTELSPTTVSNAALTSYTSGAAGLIGVGTQTPAAGFDLKRSLALSVTRVVDTDYTVAALDFSIQYSTLTLGRTVTLPSAPTNFGRVLEIRDTSGACSAARPILIAAQAGQTINGVASINMFGPYCGATLISDGHNWIASDLEQPGHLTSTVVVTAIPGDANYNVGPYDGAVVYRALTAPRAVLLPQAGPNAFRVVVVADATGTAAVNNLTVTATLSTINGLSSYVIRTNNGSAVFVSAGANWEVLGSTSQPTVTTTAGRPSAVTLGAGAQGYDTTLAIPIWSDGTNWRNAAGVIV